MREPLLVFGAGTLARLACLAAEDSGAFEVLGFAVDDDLAGDDGFMDKPAWAWSEARRRFDPRHVRIHCAIGYRLMRRRAAVFEQVRAAGYACPSLVSSHACVSGHATLGPNNFVWPGVVIEPGAQLGANNVLWSNATVCHDTRIGSHNFFAANSTLGGHVTVGDRSFLGFSCVVRERQRIGSDAILGAQSLLLQDAHDLGLYLGSPARRVRDLDPAIGVTLE